MSQVLADIELSKAKVNSEQLKMCYFNIKDKANSKTRPVGNFACFSKDSSPSTLPKIISQGKHSQSCGAQHHFPVEKNHII